MPEETFPPAGPGAQEPQRPAPRPGRGNGPQDHAPRSGAGRNGPGGNGHGVGTPGGPADGTPGGPADGWDEPPPGGPEQGLFVCLPAQAMELSRFGGDDQGPPMAPGPLLAGVAYAVAGGDGAGLAGVSEDFLFAVISGGRRLASWAAWLEFSAMRELALRHPAVPARPRDARPAGPEPPPAREQPGAPEPPVTGPAGHGAGTAVSGPGPVTGPDGAAAAPADEGRVRFGEFVADEVSLELRLSWRAAADRVSYACDLAGRLPVTFAAMGAGLIDPVHAKIIAEQTDILSAADAAKADPVLAAAAQVKTYGELRAAAARLVLKLDPDSAERRKQARRKEAHVRPFREDSGNAGMTARELPSDEVLASWQHVDQRARDLRAAGVPGTLRELRVRAYLDLLQERDCRDTLPAPSGAPGGSDGPDGNDGPGGGPGPGSGPAGRPGAGSRGPSLAALVNITVPLTACLGMSDMPGEAAGFGLMDARSVRDLIAAAARDPRTRWCLTALYPDGTAAAHGCAPGQHPAPPGPAPHAPPGPESPGPEPPGPEPPGPEPPGPEPPGTAPPGGGSPGTTSETTGGPAQRPPPGAPGTPGAPDTRARDYLRGLRVTLTPIARGRCDHRHAETGYQPSRTLRHLITTRSARCTAPGCGRPAA
ncbi:MAG: DUF222 domain-containing protein, partial [Streptosporangiaceae bacterium]